ncbi:MAG: glycosyltransferase family 2 protein [Candidatus Dadabacteria bacterium]|nr:glycosyltransferase family 2 protein [Candidatus Dadabacteria bacterium]
MTPNILVIIPVFNEEDSISKVLADIPHGLVSETVVLDNGSTDSTPDVARRCGATVISESRRGYGYACLKGIEYAGSKPQHDIPDIVVFLDGDYSDFPDEMPVLIKPIVEDGCDMVIGSRTAGKREKGALLPQALFGNALATFLIKMLYGVRFTDLGPFRAIKFARLLELGMEDKTFGWTVEMQVKAAKMGFKCAEVPVSYRKRIGTSKITGTLGGTMKAGYKILWTIFKYSRY